jgi:hypothetical protein
VGHLPAFGGLICLEPVVCPLVDLGLAIAIALLESTCKFIVIAFDLKNVIVGKFTPLLFQLALELIPPDL